MTNHLAYMRDAFCLARRAKSRTFPNPRVGCVLVKRGAIVGKGFHRGLGCPHAEVEALRQAGQRARGATLYVALEPCCHQGRTPPCTNAIVAASVRRVFYAVQDPNPQVSGRGARQLRREGLEVHGGLGSAEARSLNEVFFKFQRTGLPFVTAKVATTLDGKIATANGHSKWITDARARRFARSLREENQAVLVGIETVLADNPHLGARSNNSRDPLRIVLDSRLRIPLNCWVVASRKLIVATTQRADRPKAEALRKKGVEVWQFPSKNRVPLKPLLQRAAKHEIISVFVEGGSRVLGSFFDEKRIDKIYWFVAPTILGTARGISAVDGRGAQRLADAMRVRVEGFERKGDSWLVTGYPEK